MRCRRFLGCVMFLLLAAPKLMAQPKNEVRLTTGILRLSQVSSPENSIADSFFYHSERWYLVAQFASSTSKPPSGGIKGNLQVADKLAEKTYIISFAQKPDAAQLQALQIAAIAPLSSIPKTRWPTLDLFPKHALKNGNATVWLSILNENSLTQVMEYLNGLHISTALLPYAPALLEAYCSQQQLQDALKHPAIVYAEPAPAADKALNGNSRAMAGSHAANSNASGSPSLSGSGITIGVGDDADPTLHPDLRDRIINHTPGIVNNHGTHVSGTVGGAGIIQPLKAGYAPEANIISQFFSGIWQNAATYVQDYGLVVTNNSYGTIAGECDKNGEYTLQSRLLDLQAAQLPELVHVFASGNDGDFTCAPFPKHYATVLQGYQVGKNVITVGRTDYSQLSSASSSSGPVRDGRLKPEITALGEAIESTRGNYTSAGSAYYQEWGTSMSSPAVAGGLAQLNQRYRQLHGGTIPTSALMKAILLNGARDIGTPGPDFRHGFGFLHIGNSLRVLNNQQHFVNSIGQSQVQDQIINVSGGAAALRVMLYWHDPAASPLAAKTLVNDLDLEVVAPGGSTILPLVLNSNAVGVTTAAAPGEDHTNNVEQVVINLPQAGNYTLRVKGWDIASGSQQYALVWDTLPGTIHFTTPQAGQAFASGSNMPVVWDDFTNAGEPYTIELSTNNGNTWQSLSANHGAGSRFFQFAPSAAALTTNARLRISRTGATAISDTFTLMNTGAMSVPLADQCPGSIMLRWTSVPGVDGYEVVMKMGEKMQVLTTTPATENSYWIKGLHRDSTYYLAVKSKFNGQTGTYKSAIEVRPNGGACSLPQYAGDLAIDSILSPIAGRDLTNTSLANTDSIRLRILNRSNTGATQFALRYRVNGGTTNEVVVNQSIPANGSYILTLKGFNFAGNGTYQIEAVVQNLGQSDPNSSNDSASTVIRQLGNTAINLNSPQLYGFEEFEAIILSSNRTGIANSRWDFSTGDRYGRLRSLVTSGIAKTGNRAITLDVSKAAGYLTNPVNYLTGTFNLSNYTTAQDIRLDFAWQHHGEAQIPHAQNKVWVRGTDADNWIEAFDLGTNQSAQPGNYKLSASIQMANILQAAGQSFSSSSQVRFGQYAIFGMADATHFAGYTIDDVRLMIATNDVQLTLTDSSDAVICGGSTSLPVQAKVYNSSNGMLTNVPIRFRVNNGAWVQETINVLPPKDTIDYAFTASAVLPENGAFNITIEVLAAGDNIGTNNLVNKKVFKQEEITEYPYLQNFEAGDGGWFAGGFKNSWEYGTPASTAINKAASGSKAWKTTLAGQYNDNEKSYLYSPCFNLQGMNKPTLSFSMAYDIEDCRQFNVLCDGVWVEYSTDGFSWQKLGNAASGTNWYDNASQQAWTLRNQTHWHVATTALPKIAGNIRLRIVVAADDFTPREGVAIDDVHVYDETFAIYAQPQNSDSLIQSVAPGPWKDFTSVGAIVASIRHGGAQPVQTGVKAWVHNGAVRSLNDAYYSQRNLTIATDAAAPTTGNFDVRFYITDAEVNELRNANACGTCSPIKDFTQLNVQRYKGIGTEDGDLFNNTSNGFFTITPELIKRVPFANGYYYEFSTDGLSEWWLTNAKATPPPLAISWLQFDAVLQQNHPELQWRLTYPQDVLAYTVQVSANDSLHFVSLETISGGNSDKYSYADKRSNLAGTYYYRIMVQLANGQYYFSNVKSLTLKSAATVLKVFPVPADNRLHIITQGFAPGKYTMQIVNASGISMLRQSNQLSANQQQLAIDISTLSAGWYVLELWDEYGNAFNTKFNKL